MWCVDSSMNQHFHYRIKVRLGHHFDEIMICECRRVVSAYQANPE